MTGPGTLDDDASDDPGRGDQPYPACPLWCREPGGHDVPVRGPRLRELLRRKHVGDLTGAGAVAEVRIERVDDVFVGGPVLPGRAVVVIEPIDGALTAGEFRALAADLGRAVGNLADYEVGDPLSLVDGPDRAGDGER